MRFHATMTRNTINTVDFTTADNSGMLLIFELLSYILYIKDEVDVVMK